MSQHADEAAIGIPLKARASWAGCAMSTPFVLFMVFDTAIKLMRLQIVDDTMAQLGYAAGLGFWFGVLEAALLILYLVPRTALLGAVLFTGLFGGTVATHLRTGDPVFGHLLFGVYLGVLAWGGLWLRDDQLRALFPVRRQGRNRKSSAGCWYTERRIVLWTPREKLMSTTCDFAATWGVATSSHSRVNVAIPARLALVLHPPRL